MPTRRRGFSDSGWWGRWYGNTLMWRSVHEDVEQLCPARAAEKNTFQWDKDEMGTFRSFLQFTTTSYTSFTVIVRRHVPTSLDVLVGGQLGLRGVPRVGFGGVGVWWWQRPKKSKISGRQTFMRKNFPDEARKSFPRHICQKCVIRFRDRNAKSRCNNFLANFVGGQIQWFCLCYNIPLAFANWL